MKNEISKKNEYYLPKHRYLELRYFCLQYPTWKKRLAAADAMVHAPKMGVIFAKYGGSDPTAQCVEKRAKYTDLIKLVDDCAEQAEPTLKRYILQSVTEGKSYEQLCYVPCSRNTFYKYRRIFFWLLSNAREKYTLYYGR